ncbi:hypothetical protein L0664_15125 [Octadecabacter sp. G9-8]|uniref:Uncharacterized protein n=1 Tax=Octadecabacter dasysiphoniae TaxID=2909341 RepID=A0ABS9CYP7_9RHOB|nr:hypothetical protein [Octadecabacter dasysiphoniae]MCF2872405.1 hypothetical protein [Octadecabacter dasysiphoniae]
MIKEAYRLSELSLHWQFTAAIAADQRAMRLAGMYVAVAALLLAVPNEGDTKGMFFLAAAGLACAACLAVMSALPQLFHAPGGSSSILEEDIEEDKSEDEILIELSKYNDQHIKLNGKKRKSSNYRMKCSFVMAGFSLFVMLIGQVVDVGDGGWDSAFRAVLTQLASTPYR